MEKRGSSGVIFTGTSKAFDKINCNFVIAVLQHIALARIPGNVYTDTLDNGIHERRIIPALVLGVN